MDIASLEFYNGKLYAGVYAQTGEATDTILMVWDGQDWEYQMGFDDNILDFVVYENCLFVVGDFDFCPSGIQADNIACYGENCSEALGVLEVKNESKKFKIYPNPNTGEFTVAIEMLNKDVELKVNDVTGKTIYSSVIKRGEIIKDIHLNPLPSKGIYICSFISDGKLLQTERITID